MASIDQKVRTLETKMSGVEGELLGLQSTVGVLQRDVADQKTNLQGEMDRQRAAMNAVVHHARLEFHKLQAGLAEDD